MPSEQEIIEFKNYCYKMSKDKLLFQGAGGNTSIKDDKSLFIKASGKWMNDALKEEIFVKVNLEKITCDVNKNEFSNIISSINSNLKPSIETMMHAIMPQRYIFHMHMIDILKELVCLDGFKRISNIMKDQINWIWIDYFTPGPKLAKAIKTKLRNVAFIPEIIFLQNHGVVLGADSLQKIDLLIKDLKKRFNSKSFNHSLKPEGENINKYLELSKSIKLIEEKFANILVLNSKHFKYLKKNWALYPDHIVFLGKKPFVYEKINDFINSMKIGLTPELIFVKNIGVFHSEKFSHAKKVQLKCYVDLIVRIKNGSILRNLSDNEIDFLTSWEDEKYRTRM